jgi:hypothetical protein
MAEPQVEAPGWETQRPVHPDDAEAERLDVRPVVLVWCRLSFRSIWPVRPGRDRVDTTLGLRCNQGSAGFVTSRTRAVACVVEVQPLRSY